MIVYYVSSHGYGHAIRSCGVIRHLPPEIPLTLRTRVPGRLFAQELDGRPFDLAPAVFDVGTLGPDSSSIDLEATIAAAERMADDADAALEGEAALLGRLGARVVVSDIAPPALAAARLAGIPSILIANFTWPAIYRHLVEHENPGQPLRRRALALCDRLQAQCDQGDLLLVPDMAVPFEACRKRIETGLVTRGGVARRAELAAAAGLDPARPIALLYLGLDGVEGMDWSAAPEGWQLVSFNPIPRAGDRVRVIDPERFGHTDAAATADCMIAKAGYGICGEAIATSTPLLYPPRPQFAEIDAIDALMERWGGGVKLPEGDFKAMRWGPWLERLPRLRARMRPIDVAGAPACAAQIAETWRPDKA